MSRNLEVTPVKTQDDSERLIDHSHIEAVRNQLDERLLTPSLTDEQREVIIEEATRSAEAFLRQDPLDWGFMAAVNEQDRVNRLLAQITDNQPDDRMAPSHMQAMKYFSGTLLESIRSKEIIEDDPESARKIAGMVQSIYLSTAPNITSYAGGLKDRLELVSYAHRSPLSEAVLANITGDIIYKYANGSGRTVLAEAIADPNKTPIAQLEIIDALSRLAHQAPSGSGAWATPFTKEVSVALDNVAGGQGDSSPFVRLAAAAKGAEVRSGWGEEKLAESNREWQKQKQQFADTDLVEREEELLRVIYDPSMRALVEQQLSVDLEQLSPEAQLRLVTFMTEADTQRYERLVGVLQKTETSSRQQLAEAFLALEFGDDFGDILLDLAESEDAESVADRLGDIITVRQSGERIARLFTSEDYFDQTISAALPDALAKRTTELLALARQEGIEAVGVSLSSLAQATAEIASATNDGAFKQVGVSPDVGSFRAEDRPVTITARPHGANARLGFTVSIDKQRLSIRLDYEDGALSLDIGSTAKEGVDSSDLARQVGTDLARGERALAQLRATEQHATLHGNHVRETFEHLSRIEPEQFAGVVNRFMYRLWYRDRLQ